MGFGHRIYEAGDVRRILPMVENCGSGRIQQGRRDRRNHRRCHGSRKEAAPISIGPAGRLYNALGLKNSLHAHLRHVSRRRLECYVIEQHEQTG